MQAPAQSRAASVILRTTQPRASHDAFLVRDLDEARRLHAALLGCREGRRAAIWMFAR